MESASVAAEYALGDFDPDKLSEEIKNMVDELLTIDAIRMKEQDFDRHGMYFMNRYGYIASIGMSLFSNIMNNAKMIKDNYEFFDKVILAAVRKSKLGQVVERSAIMEVQSTLNEKYLYPLMSEQQANYMRSKGFDAIGQTIIAREKAVKEKEQEKEKGHEQNKTEINF